MSDTLASFFKVFDENYEPVRYCDWIYPKKEEEETAEDVIKHFDKLRRK